MAPSIETLSLHDESEKHSEYPPKADLRKMMSEQPVPLLAPGTVDPASMGGEEPTKVAVAVLKTFNAALAADDAEALEKCFFAEQAYWKDSLALTYHMRTFAGPGVVAASLLKTKTLRDVADGFKIVGKARFMPATPVIQYIEFDITFRTGSPAATCSGKILLWPVRADETLTWKIWIINTRLDNLDVHPEDEALLQSPGRQLEGLKTFETDVFIVGAGNAAVALAARLKALGVDSIMAERNAHAGDNWALRYDCMRFHLPTSFCELPYMCYDKELQTPHLLTRMELAEQVRRYVAAFNLNIITSAEILETIQTQDKRWQIKFQTPAGIHTATAKHLVQATGFGSQKPYLPPMADEQLYKGISIHSSQFKSAKDLKSQGVSSVLIIGSANTAFDVLEDCHAAGLQATMIVRSPTYIVPMSYVCDKLSLGAYDFGVEAADHLFLTLPTVVDAQFGRNLFAFFASQEPDRYSALAKTGFPVYDSADPSAALMHNLVERAGGHYVDIGGTELLTSGKASFKSGVEPVGYTPDGLRFSDSSTASASAVIWCTGFSDKDARETVADVFKTSLPVDATWGLDSEGEIRGMWKRHLRVQNFWTMGGYTQQHRWHSKNLALQIKAALTGILPPAYRDTP